LSNAVNRLDIPLYIDDNSQVTVMQIRQKIRRVAQREGMPVLVVIDYLQLMGGSNNFESRQLEVSEISRNLKLLAREFGIPVMALSQLSRQLETRQDKRPQLACVNLVHSNKTPTSSCSFTAKKCTTPRI
jgi:replicative DNA helicase